MPRSSLREAQRAVTEERVIEALAALIGEEHLLKISMAAVAKRAGVSQPTLYRHFPTKRDLFAALGRHQFQTVTAGLAPASVDDLANAVRTVFHWLPAFIHLASLEGQAEELARWANLDSRRLKLSDPDGASVTH